MPKYYVSSGALQEIVTHKTALGAAALAIQNAHNKAINEGTNIPALGIIVGINERGFASVDDDIWILTTSVLEEAGLSSEYTFCGNDMKNLKEMIDIFEMYEFLKKLKDEKDDEKND